MSFNTYKVDTKRIEYADLPNVTYKDETELPFVSDDKESGSQRNELNAEDEKTDQPITVLDLKPEDNEIDLQNSISMINDMLSYYEPISPPNTSCMRLARNSYFS